MAMLVITTTSAGDGNVIMKMRWITMEAVVTMIVIVAVIVLV